jgi:hypothetical protein
MDHDWNAEDDPQVQRLAGSLHLEPLSAVELWQAGSVGHLAVDVEVAVVEVEAFHAAQ